jgi:two-component system NarL family sensor kinase
VRFVRNPVVQFLAIGLLLFLALAVGTTVLADRAANQEALADARYSTEVLARSVAEPALRPGLIHGEAGALDRFDREIVDRLLVGDVRRIKIWADDGRIVYSDRTELIGSRYPLDEEELDILRQGGTEAEVSDLTKPENRFERDSGGLVEVYTQIRSPEGDPLLFEAYYSAADIDQRKQDVFLPFRRITVGALLALLALATPMIWVLTQRLTGAARDRERLLVSAIDASAAERRRIARDLHDGVVQDLAGTAFSVSAVARAPETPDRLRATLESAAASLRAGLRSLRSLLVEIHPPDLRADGLAAALEDLAAPASSSGIATSVSVSGVGGATDAAVALVWRVAQEAVRNAIRHAHPSTITVTVSGDGPLVVLDVVDDGDGFDPAALRDPARYGLRGLTSLVADAGGRLDVRSQPGAGTTVHLEVARQE